MPRDKLRVPDPQHPFPDGYTPDVVALLEKSGYVNNPRCAICASRHPVTKVPVRADIEEIVIKAGAPRALNFMIGLGINVGLRQLQRHIQYHAPYLRGGLFIKKTQQLIQNSIEEHTDAETALQNIVNIGSKMVQTGELPITEKMYLEALKIQTRANTERPGHGFIKDVEGAAFLEGEVIEDSVPALPDPKVQVSNPVPDTVPDSKTDPISKDDAKDDTNSISEPNIVPRASQDPAKPYGSEVKPGDII